MNHILAFAFQEEVAADGTSMWVILAVVLVILVFIVVIIGVGLTIFFIARKRSKGQQAASALGSDYGSGSEIGSGQYAPALEASPPAESFAPAPETSEPAAEAPVAVEEEFDPTRTVAINREATVAISYGTIKFVSGVLDGQQFNINPEGSYIGRDNSLSEIVVPDPRISKRHLWIGVRDGSVVITDQASRNGTFLNDPRSERVTEATLKPGDTVIMGESDVARFEYQG